MKTLLTAVIVIAIANLLAGLGFVGWLGATDRLSKDRFNRIREILGDTVTSENQKALSEKAKSEQAIADKAAAEKAALPPKSAVEAIGDDRVSTEIRQQQFLRLRDELKQLQLQLDRRQADLDLAKRAIDDREKKYQQRLAESGKALASEQFKQALGALEAQEPADARKVLQSIIDSPAGKEQAISYLAAMSSRNRAAVLTEFIQSDEKLAADLLEQLRTRGAAPSSPTPSTAAQGRP